MLCVAVCGVVSLWSGGGSESQQYCAEGIRGDYSEVKPTGN